MWGEINLLSSAQPKLNIFFLFYLKDSFLFVEGTNTIECMPWFFTEVALTNKTFTVYTEESNIWLMVEIICEIIP